MEEAPGYQNSNILNGRPAPCAMSYVVGQEDKRMNNRTILPTLRNNAAAGYQGPVKIELLKGAGLLILEGLCERKPNWDFQRGRSRNAPSPSSWIYFL